MRSLKERKIYKGSGLVYGKWYNLFVDGDKILLFKFSHYDYEHVYDIKSYHYIYDKYFLEDDNNICFSFNNKTKYCVRVSDEDVLKYYDSI